MSTLSILKNIHASFDMFQADFEEKENGELSIYFALDNDVFSFALFPYKKLKYADLFSEVEHQDIKSLRQQAKQLAYTIRHLARRESLYIMPSHRTEYKKTIYYFFEEIEELKKSINKEELDEEKEKLKENLKKIIATYHENDSSKFMQGVKEYAPLLFELLNKMSEYDFAAKQLYHLTVSEKKLKHFSTITDTNIDYVSKAKYGKTDLSHTIQEKSYRTKNDRALINDVQAFKALLGFNQYHEKKKKLILLTGDKGLLGVDEELKEAEVESSMVNMVRDPMYLVPFISDSRAKLYEKHNEEMVNKIDALFDVFIENILDEDKALKNNIRGESKKLISRLREILAAKYIKEIYVKEEDPNFQVLKFLRDDNFVKDIEKFYNKSIETFRNSLALIPAVDIIIDARVDLDEIKYFHRHPFILCLKDDEHQQLFGKFVDEIITSHKISKKVFEIEEQMPLYMIQLITVTVMLYVEKFDLVDEYLRLAEIEIAELEKDDQEEYIYILNEQRILKLFSERKRISDIVGYTTLKESFKKFDRTYANEGQKLRVNIGECSLEMFYLYYQYYTDQKSDLSAKCEEIDTRLKKVVNKIDNVFPKRPRVKQRAEIQIYMNIASVYLFKKYFLEESDDLEKYKEFILEHKAIYATLHKEKDIGLRQIITSVIFWDIENNEMEKENLKFKATEQIKDIKNNSFKLQDYEKHRIDKFIEILSK